MVLLDFIIFINSLLVHLKAPPNNPSYFVGKLPLINLIAKGIQYPIETYNYY